MIHGKLHSVDKSLAILSFHKRARTVIDSLAGITLRIIEIPIKVDIGIRCWGHIDYLTKYCGYILTRTKD